MADNSAQNILAEDLTVNHIVSERVQATTKWCRFLSIVSIVILALFLLLMLVASSQLKEIGNYIPGFAQVPAAFFLILAIFMIALVGVLVYFLLRFATLTKRAIQIRNQEMLNKGLDALKTYFAIYAVILIIGVAGSLFNLFNLL